MGRPVASRPKTKLGCMTCRVRKVKCDEGKPHCARCTSTGRTCDGYQSLFRTERPDTKSVSLSRRDKSRNQPKPHHLSYCNFSESQVKALSANLSSKPPARGAIGFETEAMIVLEASISSPAVRSALICQNTLRSHLRHHGHITTLETENKKAFASCIKLYSKALVDLSGHIVESSYRTIHSALCCSLLFISVEIMQQNYLSSIQHFASGMKILAACKGRPTLSNGRFQPARYSGLPSVEIFVLKLFSVPCPFAKQMVAEDQRASESDRSEIADQLLLKHYQGLLSATASQTVDLVAKVADTQSETEAISLLQERNRLLESVQGLDAKLMTFFAQVNLSPIRRLIAGFQLLYFSIIQVTLSSILESCDSFSLAQQDDLSHVVSVADSLRGLAAIVAPDDFVPGILRDIRS